MEILGLEVTVPLGHRAQASVVRSGRTCIDIEGEDISALAESIEQLAIENGFRLEQREPNRVALVREEKRLVLAHDGRSLTIQATDLAQLPQAEREGSCVVLGDLRVDLGTQSIEPLREQRDPGRRTRSASWIVTAVEPDELVERVVDQAVAVRRLTRGAVFKPPENGIPCWTGEAYSKDELVKVRATLDAGRVLLEIVFVS